MALDKENKKKKSEEIVGLDDGDLKDENEGGGEEATGKIGLLAKYRKFILPVAVALGAFAITIVVIKFLNTPTQEPAEEFSSEQIEPSEKANIPGEGNLSMDNVKDNKSKDGSQIAKKAAVEEAGDVFTIDTAAIMADLAFLDYTPEMEAAEKEKKRLAGDGSSEDGEDGSEAYAGMTPQDSVDTLNWLDKEMAKLDKAKAANAKKIKELKALEYKVNQALTKIEQAESARIINLARLYDGMRPEQVAKLFENLDDNAVLAILPRMKSANAAKIMAIMPPKRAANISTKMITVLE